MGIIENAALTAKIKAVLLMDERVGATGINVDTLNEGDVHLRGHVETDVEARLAEDLAKLNGAHSVVNELTWNRVVNTSAEESPAAAGAYGIVTTSEGTTENDKNPLGTRIMDALDRDPRVNAHILRVEFLEDGMIALRGRQGTVQQRDAALEVARAIPGVSGVVDEIEIQPAY